MFLLFASSFPLIGPHQGHERELLLRGIKPVGLFVEYNYRYESRKLATHEDDEIRKDIALLKSTVSSGHLRSVSFRTVFDDELIQDWHFFCQPDSYDDMCELAAFTHGIVSCPNQAPKYPDGRDQGSYLGYRARDISLFQNGGYDSLSWPMRMILKRTHDFRVKAYIEFADHYHLQKQFHADQNPTSW